MTLDIILAPLIALGLCAVGVLLYVAMAQQAHIRALEARIAAILTARDIEDVKKRDNERRQQ